MESFDIDNIDCPICEGQALVLGTLGRLNHYRCRDCGMDFAYQTEKEENERMV